MANMHKTFWAQVKLHHIEYDQRKHASRSTFKFQSKFDILLDLSWHWRLTGKFVPISRMDRSSRSSSTQHQMKNQSDKQFQVFTEIN